MKTSAGAKQYIKQALLMSVAQQDRLPLVSCQPGTSKVRESPKIGQSYTRSAVTAVGAGAGGAKRRTSALSGGGTLARSISKSPKRFQLRVM
jgi:hypothetical protein